MKKYTVVTLTTALLACVSAYAGNYTWTGGGAPDGSWSNALNWGGTAPDSSATNLLTFSGATQLSSTNNIAGLTNSIVFANGGFALNLVQSNTLPPNGGVTNLVGSNVLSGNLNGFGNTSSGNYYLNVPAGTLNLNTYLSNARDGFKTGAGALILSGTNDASMYGNYFYIDSNSGTDDDGVVRVTSMAVITNYTRIYIRNQGAGRSTLQLDGSAGNVNLDQAPGSSTYRFSFNMRNGIAGTAPHIENLAGNNSVIGANPTLGRMAILKGTIDPGTNLIFQSDAGLLTVYGTNSTASSLGQYNFVFSGAGNGVIAATLGNGSGTSVASVIKEGNGIWMLATNLTITGSIMVNGGTLAVGTYGSAAKSSAYNVTAGATLDVTAAGGGFTLGAGQTLAGSGVVSGNVTMGAGSMIQPGGVGVGGNLTLSNNFVLSATTTNTFDLTGSTVVAGPNDLLTVEGNLTPNGAVIAIHPLPTLTVGTYRLINYTGSKTGSFGPVTFSGWNATGHIDESVPNQINLVVDSVASAQNLRWTGGNGATWDVAGSANWSTAATPDVNVFYQGDMVTFDNSSANTSVNITAAILPSSVTFNNTNANYTLSSSSGYNLDYGSSTLTKNGPGLLILNVTNVSSGSVQVNGGTLQLSSTVGAAALSAGAPNIITNSGTLDLNGKNTDILPVCVSGNGVGGQGAIVSSTYNSSTLNTGCGFRNLTLTGDTVVDTTGSTINFFAFLSYSGLTPAPFVQGNGHKLTVQGTYPLYLNAYNLGTPAVKDPDLGDIEIRSGGSLVAYYYTTLGRPDSNCVVHTGATLRLYYSDTNAAKHLTLEDGSIVSSTGNNTLNKPMVLSNGVAYMWVNGGNTLLVNGNITGNGGLQTTNYVGTLILAGSSTYAGPTRVTAGTLQVNGSLASSSSVTVDSGLDGFAHISGGTLSGTGTISSPVTIQFLGTNAPGTPGSIGTLTINNNLTIGGELLFKVDKTSPQTNDYCVVSGALANTGTGTLTLSLLNGTQLAAGDKFKLFNKAMVNGGALTVSPALAFPLTWANNLAVDGSIQVVVSQPTMDVSVSGGQMYLSWPDTYLGWVLQTQTNNLSTGLGTNWVAVPGSESSTSALIPVSQTAPAVFFRLVSPQ